MRLKNSQLHQNKNFSFYHRVKQGVIMNPPNLFDFATNELSQDAFLCWILSWADPSLKQVDQDLHDCGVALISAFFNKKCLTMPSKVDKVTVLKQHKNIDVLCVINDKFPILIEDKTDTINHSSQLQRYYKEVLKMGFQESNLIPIYYKTEDQSNYTQVQGEKFHPFLREDILPVLDGYKGTNPILLDYRSRIQGISLDTESYKTKPVEEWCWRAYRGFYMRLQTELGYGNWGYVPNQSGGFMGFWWGFKSDAKCTQHLQIESKPKEISSSITSDGKPSINNLHFKIKVDDKAMRSSLRNSWHKLYKEKSASVLELNFDKPVRFGNGKHMTTNTFYDYINCQNGFVDIDQTVLALRKANEVLVTTHSVY